jgi:hypothetical protein
MQKRLLYIPAMHYELLQFFYPLSNVDRRDSLLIQAMVGKIFYLVENVE